jgi:RimJ/RimL family protein N-acetyltransferase
MKTTLIQLNSAQVTPALKSLFDQPMPSEIRYFAVLEGGIPGQIFTDDATNPTWGIVRETTYGATYLGGTFDAQSVSEIITELRKSGDVVIGAYLDDPLIALLPTPFEHDGLAVDYTDRPLHEGLEAYLQVPEGCTVRRVDAALFERSVERDSNLAGYSTVEKALEHVVGFYLMKDDEILAESFAGPAVLGIREMGVVTIKEHRQRGYATTTAAHLIHCCEQLGNQTFWNCDKNNLPSNALARKLGYRKAQEYRVIAWFKSA